MRWQIELAFKRLKSLAQLGHVPKHDNRSSRAWLYGKLLVTLLAQKLIRIGRDISRSGYPLSAPGAMQRAMQPVAGIRVRASTGAASHRAATLLAANTLFVESDCIGAGGKVTQTTTSVGEGSCLLNTLEKREPLLLPPD